MAQGKLASARRPGNSPLIKLPIRPKAKPKGTQGATKSMTWRQGFLREYANQVCDTITPNKPP